MSTNNVTPLMCRHWFQPSSFGAFGRILTWTCFKCNEVWTGTGTPSEWLNEQLRTGRI